MEEIPVNDIVEELRNRYMDTKRMVPCDLEHRAANQIESLRQQLIGMQGRFEKDQDRIMCQVEQLAASQAREQQLRENVRLVCGPVMDAFTDGQRWNDYQEIIDQPQDTAALQAMIAKAGDVMREWCIDKACGWIGIDEAIRALPPITLKDLE